MVSEKEKALMKSLKELGLSEEQIKMAMEKAKETYSRTVNRSAVGKVVTHIVGIHKTTGASIEAIAKAVAPIENTSISIVAVHRKDGTTIWVPLSKYDSHTITAKELKALCEEYLEKSKQ